MEFWHCKEFERLSSGQFKSICSPCYYAEQIKASQSYQDESLSLAVPNENRSGSQALNGTAHNQADSSCKRRRFYSLQTGEIPFCTAFVMMYA
jgi:hypothetical protein